MKELIENVVQWGRDRGLDKVGHLAQAKYTLKETAELLDAYADGDVDKMNDAIGDILVTLIVGASNDEVNSKRLYHKLEHGVFSEYASKSDVFLTLYRYLIDTIRMMYVSIENKDEVIFYGCVVDSLMEITLYCDGILSLKDCLQLAYDEIKNRKGKLINGQFIKD